MKNQNVIEDVLANCEKIMGRYNDVLDSAAKERKERDERNQKIEQIGQINIDKLGSTLEAINRIYRF